MHSDREKSLQLRSKCTKYLLVLSTSHTVWSNHYLEAKLGVHAIPTQVQDFHVGIFENRLEYSLAGFLFQLIPIQVKLFQTPTGLDKRIQARVDTICKPIFTHIQNLKTLAVTGIGQETTHGGIAQLIVLQIDMNQLLSRID